MAIIYSQFKTDIANGTHDWDDNTQWFRVLLVSPSYTPDISHVYVSDVNTYEVDGTNYTSGFAGSGRKTITNRTLVNNGVYGVGTGDNITWTNIITGPIGYAIIYKHGTSDANSKLVGYFLIEDENNDPITPNGGDFLIIWNPSGILNIGVE